MRLLRKQYYLRYAASPEVADTAFSLTLTTNLRGLLRDWGPTTRISPVWRVAPNIPNADAGDRVSWGANILFLSGVSPKWLDAHLSRESLALLGDDSILLTLGAFSLVIISCFEEVTAEIVELCKGNDVVFENWHSVEPPETTRSSETYFGVDIERENPTEFKGAGHRSLAAVSRSLFEHASIQADDSVGLMALEFYALLAVIESRATGIFSVLSQDSVQIEAMTTQLISRAEAADGTDEAAEESLDESGPAHLPLAEPQELLLTLNAALSRLSSQALSGTSPIIQTECHFWPHSFLAIGVACLALRNIASFITGIVSDARFNQIYKQLLDLPAKWSEAGVTGRTSDLPPYLDQRDTTSAALPGHAEVSPEESGQAEADDPAPTPITYYSGRDGFRNDPLTMSAPLPSVSGCNSHQWNLGTITHELSHRILSGKIEKLLEGFLKSMDALGESSREQIKQHFAAPPATVREQAERLLGFTLAVLLRDDLENVEWDERLKNPGALFRAAKERYGVPIEETLVHVFDFYHFYGANAKSYVDFVWLSWAVQPMIARRQDDYIKRTLTALSIKHFHAENWRELAVTEFRTLLESAPLADRLKMQPAILAALLGDRLESYVTHLRKMRHLLALFHLVFKSEHLASLASKEDFPAPKSGGKQGKSRARRRLNYSATQLVFTRDDPGVPETRFTNPLMFLRDYSQSHRPNAGQAAWLLHMLAFNYLPNLDEKPE